MKVKIIVALLFGFSFGFMQAQSFNKVKDENDASEYVKNYIAKAPVIYTEVIRRDSLNFRLAQLKKPNIKVLEIRKSYKFHGETIYFKADSLSLEQINFKRDSIVQAYKKGGNFEKMFTIYNGKNGAKADVGWMDDFQVFPEFTAEFVKHKKGDIFTLKLEDANAYLVCLKLEDDRLTYRITYITREGKR